MALVPKNWNEFQHYKGRQPPWIKLHKKLLDDYDFACLPDASRALAPCIWLLASEYEEGNITASLAEIAFRLHLSEQKLAVALTPLIESGFFINSDGASDLLATRKQTSIPETERETEKEEEEERRIARTKKRSARGISLRPDWKPTEKHFTQAQDLGLDRLAVERMAEDLRVWAIANRNRAIARKADWDATFLGWMRRNAPAKSPEPTDGTPDWIKRDTERIRAERAARHANQGHRQAADGNGTHGADHEQELLPQSTPLHRNDEGEKPKTPGNPPRH